MTIIIAVKESDTSLLIGADTMQSEDNNLRIQNARKLFTHPSANIAWGIAGNVEIGNNEFSPWLQAQDVNHDWETLKKSIAEKIAVFNGNQRYLAHKSNINSPKSHLMSCLLVGWRNDVPQIYEFTDDTRIQSYIVDAFKAIGSGICAAYGAHYVLKQMENTNALDRIKGALDATVNTVSSCCSPCNILRVKNDGIDVIQ